MSVKLKALEDKMDAARENAQEPAMQNQTFAAILKKTLESKEEMRKLDRTGMEVIDQGKNKVGHQKKVSFQTSQWLPQPPVTLKVPYALFKKGVSKKQKQMPSGEFSTKGRKGKSQGTDGFRLYCKVLVLCNWTQENFTQNDFGRNPSLISR